MTCVLLFILAVANAGNILIFTLSPPHNMAPASSDALSVDSIIHYMNKSLPKSEAEAQSQLLKDSYAAIAIFCHACMLAVGFRLVGLGEDHKIGKFRRKTP